MDGTDQFWTRFLINDYAVKYGMPWVFGGVLGTEGQVMAVVPGQSLCLQCLIPEPPSCCGGGETCDAGGVLGPMVPFVSALQAMEALKILSGQSKPQNMYMLKFDLWTHQIQRIQTFRNTGAQCRCCGDKEFVYLEP